VSDHFLYIVCTHPDETDPGHSHKVPHLPASRFPDPTGSTIARWKLTTNAVKLCAEF